MAKYVGCVEHQHGHITRLRVWSEKVWNTTDRERVINDIRGGTEYRTWFRNPGTGEYESGPRIEVVDVGAHAYLRTDANRIAADNLGTLPNLAVCPF